eukprot:RCo040726
MSYPPSFAQWSGLSAVVPAQGNFQHQQPNTFSRFASGVSSFPSYSPQGVTSGAFASGNTVGVFPSAFINTSGGSYHPSLSAAASPQPTSFLVSPAVPLSVPHNAPGFSFTSATSFTPASYTAGSPVVLAPSSLGVPFARTYDSLGPALDTTTMRSAVGAPTTSRLPGPVATSSNVLSLSAPNPDPGPFPSLPSPAPGVPSSDVLGSSNTSTPSPAVSAVTTTSAPSLAGLQSSDVSGNPTSSAPSPDTQPASAVSSTPSAPKAVVQDSGAGPKFSAESFVGITFDPKVAAVFSKTFQEIIFPKVAHLLRPDAAGVLRIAIPFCGPFHEVVPLQRCLEALVLTREDVKKVILDAHDIRQTTSWALTHASKDPRFEVIASDVDLRTEEMRDCVLSLGLHPEVVTVKDVGWGVIMPNVLRHSQVSVFTTWMKHEAEAVVKHCKDQGMLTELIQNPDALPEGDEPVAFPEFEPKRFHWVIVAYPKEEVRV